MAALPHHRGAYLYLARRGRAAHQHGSRTPADGPWIGEGSGIGHQAGRAFHLEADFVVVQAFDVSLLVGNGGHYHHHVRTVGLQRHTLVVRPKQQLGRTTGRKDLVRGHHLAVHQPLGQQIRLGVTAVTGQGLVLHHVEDILEDNDGRRHSLRSLRFAVDLRLPILAEGQTDFVAIAIDGYVAGREGRHAVRYIHHRAAVRRQIRIDAGGPLRHEHIIGELGLAESIHDAAVEGIRMIAALVVEGMPQTTSYVLARRTVEDVVARESGIIKARITLCLHQHRRLAPSTAGATGRIVRRPVVHVVAPLASEVGDGRV